MKKIVTVLFVVVFSLNNLYAKELKIDELIDKMINSYGGEENLKRLYNYKQVWSVEFMTSDKSGYDNRTVKLPDYLRIEIIYPDRSEVRILNKGIGTKIINGKTINAQGPMLDAMKLQLMRLYHPLVLKSKIKSLTLTQNAKEYLLVLKSGDLSVEYVISKKSNLIKKVIGRLQMGHQRMEFLTRYEDYKLVDGIMIPHKEIKFAGSVNTAIMKLKEMIFIE